MVIALLPTGEHIYTVRQKEGTVFMNKSFNTHCNLRKFGTVIVNEYYHRCYFFNLWNLH